VNYRTTAILLALLVVLAGVVYYLQGQPSPGQAAATPMPSVVTFTPSDATKMVISSGDKSTELALSGSNWNIVQPRPTPADNSRVQGWVDQIGALSADRVIDNATDLSTYGLAQPKLNVEVDLKGGKAVKLAFGDKTPDGADYYVQVPSDPAKTKSVYLISAALGDDLASALTKPPQALPTPTALPTLVPAPTLNAPKPAATPGARPRPHDPAGSPPVPAARQSKLPSINQS
jgi:hypothetical protein